MKDKLLRLMDVEPGETGRVGLLFVMGFFMGMFLATVAVASQSQFLTHYPDEKDLARALFYSAGFGLAATIFYNFLQGRIPFSLLASLSLIAITGITAFMEFGEGYFADPNFIYYFGFTQLIPFSFIIYLVFWGSFTRLFNLKQSKRLVGTVDIGAMIATFSSFFIIPQLLGSKAITERDLYTISLFAIILFFVLFLFLSIRFISKNYSFATERQLNRKLSAVDFIRNKYILYMSLFVILSMMAINFVDFSFLNVINLNYKGKPTELASFIAYYEGTIVVFGFLVQVFAADRILGQYGMRVSLLINPLLIAGATVAALVLGFFFDSTTPDKELFMVFFIIIAMSKLFIRSLKESIDNPTFKLYLLPIESRTRIDVQTKIEGIVTAFAMMIASGLIVLITSTSIFSDLIYITVFTVPLIGFWYFSTSGMHHAYRSTLLSTLNENKKQSAHKSEKAFTVNSLLERQLEDTKEEKVIYGLKLMEKLEPALFENALIMLAENERKKISKFANEKIRELGIEPNGESSDIKVLARQAAGQLEDGDLLSISPDKLLKLSKSVKQNDRVLAAKLLRKLISQRTIFVLLELLRDGDPKVRYEALLTARRVKRPETWPVLIEMLNSPSYGHHAAAALKECGEDVLPTLEAAFHKSGQTDIVMLRIVQIMGRIGSPEAIKLMWRKADYPDKRIVRHIFYALRYMNYRAEEREAREVLNLLETEASKTIWNLAALDELPDEPHLSLLREALKEEIRENYDQITILLSILYDPESIQLVRDNVETGNPDNIAFALELLDLFIDQDLKPKLIPLFDDIPTKDKLEALQLYYPRESYTPVQVINYILNRDFNLNNRWTKVCAIHAVAYMPDFRISRGLAAQIFNHDRLLQETAAWVVYNKDKKAYEAIRERLPNKDKKFLDHSIENNQLLDGLDDGFFLAIEMVLFIKSLPQFKHIHGSALSDLADKITPIDLTLGDRIKLNFQEHNSPILVIAHGEVKLKNDDIIVAQLKKGDVYGDLFQDGTPAPINMIESNMNSVIFKIDLMDFYFVMAHHHELVQGMIKNVTQEPIAILNS